MTKALLFLPNRPAAWLMALAVLGGMLAAGTYSKPDEIFLFLGTGLWALAIMLLPVAMRRHYDPFSMWSFAILTVVIGATLRGACLTFGYPDTDRLETLFLLGREPSFFLGPAVFLLTGLLMLTLGYVAIPFRTRRIFSRFPSHDSHRLIALCLVILAVSSAATVLYIQRTGGLASGDWSAKRTVIPDLELAGSNYQSHGGLRFVASLAIFGHLLAMAEALSPHSSSAKNRPLLWLLAITLLFASCIVPFYASLRTTVAMNLCLSAAMVFYSGRRFRLPILGGAVVAGLLAIYLMTALRPSGPDRDSDIGNPTVARVFEAAIINRNQIELPKTAHILHAIHSGDLSLQFGKTVARWILAPIPRSVWPDKPVIPPGPEIGRTVYGQRVAGVPPSMVAELFWNFHLPGVIIGAFALGMGLRYVESRFRPGKGADLFVTALYVAGPMTMAFEMVGGSIGSGLFRATLHTAVMLGLLLLIRGRRTHSF